MKEHKSWDDFDSEAIEKRRRWRATNRRVSLTDDENHVEANLAELQVKIIEELADENDLLDLWLLPREEQPRWPEWGTVMIF